jgi:hypothetical protein
VDLFPFPLLIGLLLVLLYLLAPALVAWLSLVALRRFSIGPWLIGTVSGLAWMFFYTDLPLPLFILALVPRGWIEELVVPTAIAGLVATAVSFAASGARRAWSRARPQSN